MLTLFLNIHTALPFIPKGRISKGEAVGYRERVDLYKRLEEERESKIIAYITGDRHGAEAQIHSDIIPGFADHLDILFGKSDKISLSCIVVVVLSPLGGQS